MAETNQELLRSLPAVSKILSSAHGRELCSSHGEGLVKLFARQVVSELRDALQAGSRSEAADVEEVLTIVLDRLRRLTDPQARAAVNATGVLLHTGLGRAPLALPVVEHVNAAAGFGVVQVNLETNKRSLREEKIQQMLIQLTGCEAATIVNNNAAATFMLLHAISAGKEVIISRGQLVEIGGSYRMPDVMAQSGALLKEVGTTNRTHLFDYERAISEHTGALLYVEPSNYCIQGFAGFPSLEEVCALGQKHDIPVIADLGSGALVPMEKYGLKKTLTIADAMRYGAAVSCSSGDKLIGGPQAGLICGSLAWVNRIRKSPFMRMFRTDKMTLAAMEATLVEFVAGTFEQTLPLYQMLSTPVTELRQRAEAVRQKIAAIPGFQVELHDDTAYVGGGSLPTEALPSVSCSIQPQRNGTSSADCEHIARALRLAIPPVFCRIQEGSLIFDMRSLLPGDEARLPEVLHSVLTACGER